MGSSRIRAWWQAARPLAHVNLAVPLFFGAALAWSRGAEVAIVAFAGVHALAIVFQLVIVFANDLADEPGDRLHPSPTLFSGGSRVLVQGKLTRPDLRRGLHIALATLIGASAISGWLLDRPWLVVAWMVGALLLWLYSYPPARLSYRGYGEVAQGFGMGVLLPWLGAYMQAGSVAIDGAQVVPAFVLAVASNITTAIPDIEADAAVDKRTWAVRVGEIEARKHSLWLIALGILSTPLVLPSAPQAVWLTVEGLPLAALAVNLVATRVGWQRHSPARFVALNGAAINLAFAGWCAALLLEL